MKTLDDLVAFVDLVLSPGFDMAAAQRRLGAPSKWIGELARVASSDPALHGVVLETSRGALTGVQARLVSPLEVSWGDLERALGPHSEAPRAVDAWTAPVPHRFERAAGGARGVVFLYIADSRPTARIEHMIVRPARERTPPAAPPAPIAPAR